MHHLTSVGKSLNLTFCVTRLIRQNLKSQQLRRGLAADSSNKGGDDETSRIDSSGTTVPGKKQVRKKVKASENSGGPIDVKLQKPDTVKIPGVLIEEKPDFVQQNKQKNVRKKSTKSLSNPTSEESGENVNEEGKQKKRQTKKSKPKILVSDEDTEHVEVHQMNSNDECEIESGREDAGLGNRSINNGIPDFQIESGVDGLEKISGEGNGMPTEFTNPFVDDEGKEKKTKSKRKKVKEEALPAEVELKGRMAPYISAFLEDNELKYEPGFNCVATSCRKLGKNKTLKEEHKMYINLTTGFFVCHHCKQYGDYRELEGNTKKIIEKKTKRREFECFGTYNHAEKIRVNTQELHQLLDTGVPVQNMASEDFLTMTDLFDCMGLSQEQFERYNVRYNSATNTLLFPCYTHVRGELVGVNQMSVTVIPPEDEDSETVKKFSGLYTPQFEFNTLFGWSDKPNIQQRPKRAVLAASELDAMIISQETDTFALALPFNVKELSIHVLPSLECVEELIIWDSRDKIERGVWDVNRRKKLHEKRCMVFKNKTLGALNGPIQAFKKGMNLKDILKTTIAMYNAGIADFGEIRNSVINELLHKEQAYGFLWTRFPILNDKLKGLRKGELTVFTGPTGSGKTTFLSEYSLDLCQQGVNTLWGSFEISNTRLVKMMLSQLALENVQNFTAWEIDHWYDQLELLPMKFMTFHSQQNILKVMQTLEHGVYMHDINHVIIDNLQFMMGSAYSPSEDRYAKQDMIFGLLRAFATEKNCHVTLVIHPRKERFGEPLSIQSIFGGVRASQEADNVLILQERKITPTKSKKHIEISKNRFAGDLGVMSLSFDKETLSFSKSVRKSQKSGEIEEESSSGGEYSEDDYYDGY